ncbi:hypothetical protein SLA2020_172660 [Shorea laevis]
MCRELWDSDNLDWVDKPAEGMSGGLLCIWCSNKFRKESKFEGPGFIRVSGFWGDEKIPCHFVNVYAACDLQRKRLLWEELGKLISTWGGNWCIGGDFNATKTTEERKGCSVSQAGMKDFTEFIDKNGLVDLPLIGRRYTWYQPNGAAMSRLDRFLFSRDWMDRWAEMKQWGLRRGASDHCPILAKNKIMDWGPKPFRFFNAWLSHPEFKDLFSKQWNSFQEDGWACFKLKEKFKKMKQVLKKWSDEHFKGLDGKIEAIRQEVASLDIKGESQQLSEEEEQNRKCKLVELNSHMQKRESMLRQKSRKMWLKEGDENSRFFHQCIKGRQRRNEINGILVDGRQLSEVQEIKQGVANHFLEVFTEEPWLRPTLKNLKFQQVSSEENAMLVASFSEKEIKEVVWDCSSTKAPGPDGFNFGCLKSVWEVIKEDIIQFV